MKNITSIAIALSSAVTIAEAQQNPYTLVYEGAITQNVQGKVNIHPVSYTIKAVATVTMFNSGVVRRNGFMNSQVSTIQDRLKQASNARALEAAGGEVLYANNSTTPLTDEQIAKLPFDLYREGYLYYSKTHAHPNASSKYTLSSLMDLMTFDASTNMDLINQPLLMIAGSKADTYYMTDDAFGKATQAKNKESFLINGATHIETYWKPEYVAQAVNALVHFYQVNL